MSIDETLSTLQDLHEDDKELCLEFILGKMTVCRQLSFVPSVFFFFFDEMAKDHRLNWKVNHHNVRIWGIEQPHEIVKYVRDSPKLLSALINGKMC